MGQTADRVNNFDEYEEVETDEPAVEIEVTRAQIEVTRSEMSETIDAIKERLSPQNLVQEAKESIREATVGRVQEMAGNVVDSAKQKASTVAETAMQAASTAREGAERVMSSASETAKEASSTIVETIQRNPLPSALIGIGVGWLWMNNRKQSAYQPRYEGRPFLDDLSVSYEAQTPYPQTQPQWGEQQTSSQSSVRQTLDQAKERVGEVTEQVQQRVGDATEKVQQRVSQVAAQTQEQAQRAATAMQQMLWENPLAVGALAMTLGAAVGMAVPASRPERQMMGEARDRLIEKAQQTTQEVAQKVQNVAHEALDTAKEEARSQGLTS